MTDTADQIRHEKSIAIEIQEDVPVESWMHYFSPSVMTKLMNKKFLKFGGLIFFYYIVQFMCCVCACNFYSDRDRLAPCISKEGTLLTGEKASEVMDLAIKLAGIFHVIEWTRTMILLTVVCLGPNLMHMWYLSALSALYGIAAFIYLMFIFWKGAAASCKASQPHRYNWLMVEVIYFWTLFFVFQFPMMVYRLYTKTDLETMLNEESNSDEDE